MEVEGAAAAAMSAKTCLKIGLFVGDSVASSIALSYYSFVKNPYYYYFVVVATAAWFFRANADLTGRRAKKEN